MASLLAAVLPLALGAAVSPTLLALQLLVLTGSTRRMARAWALAAGAALVLAGFMVLCATVLARLVTHHGRTSTTGAVVALGAAALLIGLAARTLLHRPEPGATQRSALGDRLATAPTGWFVGAGALGMATNLSTLVLVLPAMHEITRSDAGTGAQVAAAVLLYVVTLLPVLVPVVGVVLLGARADGVLASAHGWVTRNSRRIAAGVELAFAAYLTVKGVRQLP